MSELKENKSKKKGEKNMEKTNKERSVSQEQKQRKAEKAASTLGLLADNKAVDPALFSLFAVKQPAIKPRTAPIKQRAKSRNTFRDDENDAELSELDEADSDTARRVEQHEAEVMIEEQEVDNPPRKRKRKPTDDELEDVYMSRLAREDKRDAERLAAERVAKRQKQVEAGEEEDEDMSEREELAAASDASDDVDQDREPASPPPKHETEQKTDEELAKASRTVFLGNVSSAAITSKSSRKALLTHLASFFAEVPDPKDSGSKHKVESIRFRSTSYASAIPKKAAYAKHELMDATTKSTNAYAVYSSPQLAKEAAKRLNGTIVLDRHLRVDEVAHPAKVDNRRCIFVGNLGFVDDETNIQDANEEEGREKRKRGKEPADIEEGLWRTFAKCGSVESVRVIRDSTTRVGKGIAYVQFDDENAVEAALLFNEKKFPPMLPRKLRVSRAKAQKRNAKPGSGRPSASKSNVSGYQRKLTGEESSRLGRTGKLLGRAAAAQVQRRGGHRSANSTRPARPSQNPSSSRGDLGQGIKAPENFVFEGHRATAKQGKNGLKLGGKHATGGGGSKKKKIPITKRSASFKAKKRTAA